MNPPPLTRYENKLPNAPAPGTGADCHSWIMSMANLGIMGGKDPHEIEADLRRAIPRGKRRLLNSEIPDAINKAMNDLKGGSFVPRRKPEPVVKDGKAARQRIIDQAKITTEVDLFEASPIRLWDDPKGDPVLLLETLYEPTDLVWIGERHQTGINTIMAVQDWIAYIRCGGKAGPHIIPNPMTGQEGTTKDGKPSFRTDNTVKTYRFCVAEFDGLSREDQIRFWSAVKLPIAALIDSGGKSIHAWIDVQKLAKVETAEQGEANIKDRLYSQILVPMGIDSQCSNPSRLSRMPGHYREEKQAWQRLLWLSKDGQAIC